MAIQTLYSAKRIEQQFHTGEEPVMVMCSDVNIYVCKYMRSSATAYKLACELIGAKLAKAWRLTTPDIALVNIRPAHWEGINISHSLSAPSIGFQTSNGQRPSGRTSWIVLTKTFDNMKYSIIYAVIRPEISERVSLGMIFVDGDKVDVRYSQQKLEAVRGLFSPKEYEFLSEVVRSMPIDGNICNVDSINYLTRYSNNLIAVSPLQSIDIAATEQSKDSLFRNYIYEAA